MTSREKLLAAGVAGTAVLYFGLGAFNKFNDAVTAANNQAITAVERLGDANAAVKMGEQAYTKLHDWADRSLPTDREVAKSLYQDWVRAQLRAAGLTVEQVADKTNYRNAAHYSELAVEARATGSLQQLTSFLYKFYTAPHLHRISTATITPTDNGAKLSAVLGIDALILPNASRKSELAKDGEQPLPQPLEAYSASLASRNVFAPHARGGRERRDDSAARMAKFSGFNTDGAGGYHMWIQVENDSRTRKYKVGDKIEYGEFSGTLLEVDPRHAVIETARGKVEVRLGKTLGDATPVDA
jgi:hypothetical protein